MTSEQSIQTSSDHALPETVRSVQGLQEIQGTINELIGLGHQAEITGNVDTAVQNYTESLRMLNETLVVLNTNTSVLSLAMEMQRTLSLTKENVSMRLESLQTKASHSRYQESQPHLSAMFSSESVRNLHFLVRKVAKEAADATEIFSIPDAVSVFFISADGTVTTSYEQFSLHIAKFNLVNTDSVFSPPAFLQVDNWLYPLMPGLSPALITEYGAYIFPDVFSGEKDRAVALVFSVTVSEFERKKFESILNNYTMLDKAHGLQAHHISSDISEVRFIPRVDSAYTFGLASMVSFAITLVASVTSWIITILALALVWLLQTGSEYIQAQIQPATEPQRVDPMVRKSIIYVKTATAATVKVQQYVVDKLGEGALTLAKNIAPFIQEQGENILPESFREPSNEFVKGTAQITASSLKGITKVYNSLDRAADSLIDHLTDESFQIIQHTYGEEVGTLARNTLSTAKGVALMARSAKDMNLMRFAASAGKRKGSIAFSDHVRRASMSTHLSHPIATPNEFRRASTKVHENTQTFVNIFERIRNRPHPSEEDHRSYSTTSIEGVIKVRASKLEKWTPLNYKLSRTWSEAKRSRSGLNIDTKQSVIGSMASLLSNRSRYSQLSREKSFDKNVAIAIVNKQFSQYTINALLTKQKVGKHVENSGHHHQVDVSQRNEKKLYIKHTDGINKQQISQTSVHSNEQSKYSASNSMLNKKLYLEKGKTSIGGKSKLTVSDMTEKKEAVSKGCSQCSFFEGIEESDQESIKEIDLEKLSENSNTVSES